MTAFPSHRLTGSGRLLMEAIVVTAAIMWICEQFRPNFFFHDETLRQYGPVFQYIGRSLLGGEWPLLTLDVMQGGYLLGEYQYGLLNPATLLCAVAAGLMPTVKMGALVMIAIHLALLWIGASKLIGNFGVSGLARSTFAFLVVGNNFLIYWYASSWTAGLIGHVWFVWLLAMVTAPHMTVPVTAFGAFSLYAVCNSGWPHALIAAGVMLLAIGATSLLRRDWHRAARIAVLSGAAVTASLLAILPTAEALRLTERVPRIANEWMLVPMLSDILNAGAPSYLPRLNTFSGASVTSTPIFFLGWFVFAVLPLFRLDARKLRSTRLLGIGVGTGLLLLASLGPEQVGALRWPFRFVIHAQIGLLVLFFVLLDASRFRKLTLRTVAACLALAVIPQLLAIQTTPGQAATHLLMTLVIVIMLGIAIATVNRAPRYFWNVALATSAIVFVFTHYWFPLNQDINWDHKVAKGDESLNYESIRFDNPNESEVAYVFALLPRAWWISTRDNLGGYLRLTNGRPSVNGYSPMTHARLSELFCLGQEGEACEKAWSRLFDKEPATGIQYADLLRVTRIVLPSPRATSKAETVSPEWRDTAIRHGIVHLVREPRFPPGTLSYVGSSLVVPPGYSASHSLAARERFHIQVRSSAAENAKDPVRRALIFARTWWPGYTAHIDGRPIPVRPHDGLLVRIDVPESISGSAEVVLSFTPLSQGIRPFLIPAALVLLLAGLVFSVRLQSSPR